MPKRKKRGNGVSKKRKDDSPDNISECDSLERPPSAKKVAAASSTSHLEEDMEPVSSFTSISLLNSAKSESGDAGGLLAHFWCNYCEFSADDKKELVSHMRQHMIKCPDCPFSSLSRSEVVRHCKLEHNKEFETASQEVDSSSTECEMDKDPCSACVFCSFMTYSTEHLEKHTALKHPGMIAKSVAKMISKQTSAEVRKDDAVFYHSVTVLGNSTKNSTAVESSTIVIIDTTSSKTEDIKPEVESKLSLVNDTHVENILSPVKQRLAADIFSDILTKGENGGTSTKQQQSLSDVNVKVESLYCLTCPYSNVYIEKIKCHTFVQHPVGAAAATLNSSGECLDPQDITFFCVREDCSHSSADISSFQIHLINCCSCTDTLTVIEKERLKATITFISELMQKHNLKATADFLDFASLHLGTSSSLHQSTKLSTAAEDENLCPKSERASKNKTSTDICMSIGSQPNSSSNSPITPNSQSPLPSAPVTANPSGTATNWSGGANNMCTGQHYQNNVVGNIQNEAGSYQSQNSNSANVGAQYQKNCSVTGNMDFSQQNQNLNSEAEISHDPRRNHWNSISQPGLQNYQDIQQVPNMRWSQAEHMSSSAEASQIDQTHHNVKQPQQSQNLLFTSSGFQKPEDQINLQAHLPQSVDNGHINPAFAPASVSSNYAAIALNDKVLDSSNFSGGVGQTLSSSGGISSMSNMQTDQGFSFGQHQTSSSVYNTGNPDLANTDMQPQPKMLDLLSDTYSILLNDFESDDQVQNISSTSQTQPQQTSLHSDSSYANQVSVQNQGIISEPSSLTPEGDSIHFHTAHQELTSVQGGNSYIHGSSRVAIPQGGHLYTRNSGVPQTIVTNSYSNNNNNRSAKFQSSHVSESPGIQNSPISSNLPLNNQVDQPYISTVPNFLGTSSTSVPDEAPAQQSSLFLQQNAQHTTPVSPVSPRSANTGSPFASASPLSPSIYLSGQVPRHRRSNWTDADMRPRGMPIPAMHSRGAQAPIPTLPSPQGRNVRQRLFAPVPHGRGRGYPRASRGMPSNRMPQPMMPGGSVGDDDDVIVTAVTRITSRHEQQQQQSPGRQMNRGARGSVLQGRGRISIRGRGQGGYPRAPHPVPMPLHVPQKQFDISKHFEDLACVVNSSADEEDPNRIIDDDIEIVSVIPGKDKERPNQPKAVDASKFSFCCVHCGKDQGSKKVMKQHMKARHNDSLLGAFTNTETGQLLFFCPQLTCEFMTYDEKRLSDHLSKCFDLDKSRPFDFGTAIKNLKSLKIRQLDMRSMGGSQNNPINLNGRGLKDNFSNSLNDAFDDIVVNTSGRQIFRPATPPQQVHPPTPRHTLPPSPKGTIRGPPPPVRNQPPGHIGQRMRSYPEPVGMQYQVSRSVRHPRIINSEMRTNLRQALGAPGGPHLVSKNVREMRPRLPNPGPYHPQVRGPFQPQPHPSMTGRSRVGSLQEPIVIDFDADSPERPQENGQDNSTINQHSNLQNLHFPPTVMPSTTLQKLSTPSGNNRDVLSSANVHQSESPVTYPDTYSSPLDCMTTTAVLQNLSKFVSSLPIGTTITSTNSLARTQVSDTEMLPVDSRTSQQTDSVVDNFAATHEYVAVTSDPSAINSVNLEHNNCTKPTNVTPVCTSANTSAWHAAGNARASENQQKDGDANVQSMSAVTTISTSSTCESSIVSNAPPTLPDASLKNEYFDEEEKVNTVLLQKVFEKVPNMPKNLSRRLVAKFKQYAHFRGVKITADSKVIDEFVSKIYYKGSNTDKDVNKVQASQTAMPLETTDTTHLPGGTLEDTPSIKRNIESNSAWQKNESKPEAVEKQGSGFPGKSTNTNDLHEIQEEPSTNKEAEPLQNENKSASNKMGSSSTGVLTTNITSAQQNSKFSGVEVDFATYSTTAQQVRCSSEERKGGKSQHTSEMTVGYLILSKDPAIDIPQERRGTKPIRSSSLDSGHISQVTSQVKRSNSFPESEGLCRPCSFSDDLSASKSDLDNMPSEPPSSISPVTAESKVPNFLSVGKIDHGDTSDLLLAKLIPVQSPVSSKDLLQATDQAVIFPSVKKGEVEPILIPSSVDHLIEGHPSLEVDIAGSPCKEEPIEDEIAKTVMDNKALRQQSLETSSDMPNVQMEESDQTVKKTVKMVDKVTGQLLLKKTKRARAKIKVAKNDDDEVTKEAAESDEDEEKDGEHFVRRSSRSRKPVQREYHTDINEIDELMSDEDEEYNIDDDDGDYGTDSGSDKSRKDGSGQPSKKKAKRVKLAPDPTAFDIKTKGRFKCWICKKVFNKCTSTKVHIIKKHVEGLCAVHIELCEETSTLCLLLFCPRICKYVTSSLEGFRNHINSCDKPLFKENGEKYLEVNSKFIETSYQELLSKDVKDVMSISQTKRRIKSGNSKKSKVASEVKKSLIASVIIHHSEASGPLELKSSEISAAESPQQVSFHRTTKPAGSVVGGQQQSITLPTTASSGSATTISSKPNTTSSSVNYTASLMPVSKPDIVFTNSSTVSINSRKQVLSSGNTLETSNSTKPTTVVPDSRPTHQIGPSVGGISTVSKPSRQTSSIVHEMLAQPSFPLQKQWQQPPVSTMPRMLSQKNSVPAYSQPSAMPQQAKTFHGQTVKCQSSNWQSGQMSHPPSQSCGAPQIPSASSQEEDVYMVEENGTICLE